jgi:hypothetical protein
VAKTTVGHTLETYIKTKQYVIGVDVI